MGWLTPNSFLIQAAGIMLIPLIPAVLLYALLPSRATVSGPFKGLNIRLQGAFGGYFLLVLILTGLLVARVEADARAFENGPRFETWKLRGKVKFSQPIQPASLRTFKIFLEPQPARPIGLPNQHSVQTFEVDLPVKITRPGGTPEFPFLAVVFDHPDFHTETFSLDSDLIVYRRDMNKEERKIVVRDVIELPERSPLPETETEGVEATAGPR